jgi:hypothetical protein
MTASSRVPAPTRAVSEVCPQYQGKITPTERWPAPITEMLEKVASSLEIGRPYENRYRPKVSADGAVVWDILRHRHHRDSAWLGGRRAALAAG